MSLDGIFSFLNVMGELVREGLLVGMTGIALVVLICGPIFSILNGFSCELLDDKAVVKKILIKSGNQLILLFLIGLFLLSIGLNWTKLVFATEPQVTVEISPNEVID